MTLDAKSSNLIALAVPADQQLIRATLQQLQPGLSGDAGPTVRFHPLVRAPSEGLLNILKEMVPTAQVTPDAENKRLIAVATAADHDAIQKIIEQFESSTPPEEPRKLAVYPVTAAQKKRFQAVLPSLQTDMPGLQVLSDADPGSLTVWAKPSEQIKVGELIKQLEGRRAADRAAAVGDLHVCGRRPHDDFHLRDHLVSRRQVRGGRQVAADPGLGSAAGSREDQARTGATGQRRTPGDFEPQFQAYPLSKVAPEVAVPLLQQQLPEAKLVADATSKRVLAWASKADQAVIAKAIEQLQAGADDQNKPRLVVYPRATPIRRRSCDAHQPRPDGPSGRRFPDRRPGGLGHAGEHETIRKAIEEMSKEEVTAGKPSHQGVRAEAHHRGGGPAVLTVGRADRQGVGRRRRQPSGRRRPAARAPDVPGHPAGDRRRGRGRQPSRRWPCTNWKISPRRRRSSTR